MRAEVLLANLSILAGDTASSVHHQRRAVDARPESFRLRTHLAAFYACDQRVALARQEMQEALDRVDAGGAVDDPSPDAEASARFNLARCDHGLRRHGEAVNGFRAYVGVNFEQAESEEAGVSQSGLFSRIVAAADGDGYFGHLSHDLYPGHGRGPPLHHPSTRDVVPRIGIVRREGSGTDALYVLSSFRYAPPAPDALCLPPVLGPWT